MSHSRSSYGSPPKGPNKGGSAPVNTAECRVSPSAPTVNHVFSTPGLGEGCCKGERVTPIGKDGGTHNKPSNGNKPSGGF